MEGILDKASSKYLKKERVVPLICKGAKKKQEKGMKKQGCTLHTYLGLAQASWSIHDILVFSMYSCM